jgi:hypothetical protein
MDPCATCGVAIQADWRYCEGCGSPQHIKAVPNSCDFVAASGDGCSRAALDGGARCALHVALSAALTEQAFTTVQTPHSEVVPATVPSSASGEIELDVEAFLTSLAATDYAPADFTPPESHAPAEYAPVADDAAAFIPPVPDAMQPDAVEPDAVQPDPAPEPPLYANYATQRVRSNPVTPARAVAGGIVVVVLVAVAVLATGWRSSSSELKASNTQLAAAKAQLNQTKDALAASEQASEGMKLELTGKVIETQKTAEELAATKQEASGVRQSLADSQKRVDLQANQISVLKTCLDGIARADYEAAHGSYDVAVSILNSVQPACRKAAAYL